MESETDYHGEAITTTTCWQATRDEAICDEKSRATSRYGILMIEQIAGWMLPVAASRPLYAPQQRIVGLGADISRTEDASPSCGATKAEPLLEMEF